MLWDNIKFVIWIHVKQIIEDQRVFNIISVATIQIDFPSNIVTPKISKKKTHSEMT